ncbi:DUF6344 domain-containing protein [Streptomyces sp. NPDC101733]|uniref:DUF6344 domain-containing protein n=1 Tax=unclassified Streptomyces TaxID=2593676 RepID=UPI0037FC6CDB
MTNRSSITSIWTTVLAALVAFLTALGLGGKAAPVAAAASVSAPAAPSVRRPAVVARRTWRETMRGGSLPPTIKQRIRAEAHGKSPSVRRSTTAAALAGDAVREVPLSAGRDQVQAQGRGQVQGRLALAA